MHTHTKCAHTHQIVEFQKENWTFSLINFEEKNGCKTIQENCSYFPGCKYSRRLGVANISFVCATVINIQFS